MTTFDDIERTRTSRFGSDWVAFLNSKYSRQQAVSLIGKLSMYFVDCSRGRIVLDLQGGGRLWRMFTRFEVLGITIDEPYGGLIFARGEP